MKITKILYVVAVSTGILLSSCSMNKEANNTSYQQSGKLRAEQQLVSKNIQKQPMATIDASANQKPIENNTSLAPYTLNNIQVPVIQKHFKSFATNSFINKAGKSLVQNITLPKAVGAINTLIKRPGVIAASKSNPFAGMNYLVMWIVCLVASILLYAIGGLLGPIGILFDILGLIAGIFFVVFLILWILQLAKG